MESAYYSNVFNGKVKNHLLKEKHRASVTSMSDVESFSGLDDEEKRQSMPGRQTNKCENIFEEDFIDGFAIMSFKSLNDLKVSDDKYQIIAYELLIRCIAFYII